MPPLPLRPCSGVYIWGVVCLVYGVWVKTDCNCKSARQKLKDQQTDKNGGRQVLPEIVVVIVVVALVVTVVVVVAVILGQVSTAAVSVCHRRCSVV